MTETVVPGHAPDEDTIAKLKAEHGGRLLFIRFEDQFDPELSETVVFKVPTPGQYQGIVNRLAKDSEQSGSLLGIYGADLVVWPESAVFQSRTMRSFPGAASTIAGEAQKIGRGERVERAKKA